MRGKIPITSFLVGIRRGRVAYRLSVFEPVDVPQCWQRYSYRFPVGSTSRSRSRVGVATLQDGQYSSDAFNDLNWSGCLEVSCLGGRFVLGGTLVIQVGLVGLCGRPDIKLFYKIVVVNTKSRDAHLFTMRCWVHPSMDSPGTCRSSFQTPRPACTIP